MSWLILISIISIILLLELYKQLKKLSGKFNQQKEILLSNFEEKGNDDSEKKKNNDNTREYLTRTEETYKGEEDYTDRFEEWVQENKEAVKRGRYQYCLARCWFQSFEISNSYEELTKGKIKSSKSFCMTFSGGMRSYFGCLPDMQGVCAVHFIIHFSNDKPKIPAHIMVSQMSYNDIIGDTEYYKGRHIVTIEVYEEISALENYKLLLAGNSELSASLSFELSPHIEIEDGIINGHYKVHVGKLNSYSVLK